MRRGTKISRGVCALSAKRLGRWLLANAMRGGIAASAQGVYPKRDIRISLARQQVAFAQQRGQLATLLRHAAFSRAKQHGAEPRMEA